MPHEWFVKIAACLLPEQLAVVTHGKPVSHAREVVGHGADRMGPVRGVTAVKGPGQARD